MIIFTGEVPKRVPTSLISVEELLRAAGRDDWVIVDCRFDLAAPAAGHAAYVAGHVPGAVYADLERDLSGPPTTDRGRHPLPPPARLRAVFGAVGIADGRQVVVYDDTACSMAARLWWMLRYMGHDAVAVLDGGWQAWCAAGAPIETGARHAERTRFTGQPRRARLVTLPDIRGDLDLIDARDPARFRGEAEPIDPRAGHIPGARNHCWKENLDERGRFKTRLALREAFQSSLGTLPDAATVHYCGSGVSACHNVLAQVHAGLPEPKLYCGSWSEWCRDPGRPAVTGGAGRMNQARGGD